MGLSIHKAHSPAPTAFLKMEEKDGGILCFAADVEGEPCVAGKLFMLWPGMGLALASGIDPRTAEAVGVRLESRAHRLFLQPKCRALGGSRSSSMVQ